MRLRNVPGAREEIAADSHVIPERELGSHRGKWRELFGNTHPLYLEIGTGKGGFITELAGRNPGSSYIGIEKYSSVLVKALRKLEKEPELRNLFLIRMDAEYLTEVFAPEEVNGIYLNFSDPWPKDRHAKRRLPGREFLEKYARILAPGGRVEFKTDNQDLFSFAVESAKLAGYRTLALTYDLHHDPVLSEGNIMTEYEARFSSMGHPICKLILERRP